MHEFLSELLGPFVEFVVEVAAQFMSWRLALILLLTAIVSGAIIYGLYFMTR